MNEYMTHRKFIHDIANEMAIIDGGIRFALKNLPDEIKSSEIYEILEVSHKHVKDCITQLKEYRTFISQSENGF